MNVKCAECQCTPVECTSTTTAACKEERKILGKSCINCTKDVCCCIDIHSHNKQKIRESESSNIMNNKQQPLPTFLLRFFHNVKMLYATALGIEVLCILAAEIGENSSFAVFGYKTISVIVMGYLIGYVLSTFTTFATILGRYNYDSDQKVCSCCSVLEENDNSKGFILNLLRTFRNFIVGIKKMPQLYKQPNLMSILKTSIIILITAESACIITAETVDLFLYKHSILLSIPLSLIAGAFTVAVPEAYRRTKRATEQIQSDGFVTFRELRRSKNKIK
jgi:hypothetical protein